MTPYDIYRAFLQDLSCTPPEEEIEVKLIRVAAVLKKLEKIHDQGCMTEAAGEAIAVMVILRRYEAMVRLYEQ